MLLVLVDLGEGPLHSRFHEHRVITEALVAARWPDERAVTPSLETLDRAVGRCQRQDADEVRVMSGVGPGRLDLAPHPLHRPAEIALAVTVLGPAGGEDAGVAVERIDRKAAVVGQRREPRQVGSLAGLQLGIVDEGDPGLVGLGKIEFLGADALDPERRQQRPDLTQLTRIMRGDDELGGLVHRPTAFSWPAKMSAHPMRARRSRRSNCSSSKVAPSAEICASTIDPSPVRTKLPSDPADESSI